MRKLFLVDKVYLAVKFKNCCIQQSIHLSFAPPKSNEQNGVVERMIRTLSMNLKKVFNVARPGKDFFKEGLLHSCTSYN